MRREQKRGRRRRKRRRRRRRSRRRRKVNPKGARSTEHSATTLHQHPVLGGHRSVGKRLHQEL